LDAAADDVRRGLAEVVEAVSASPGPGVADMFRNVYAEVKSR
jgi:TPP-dependent pyruvate/acetoin dehydrogenase alpha subunit